MNQKFRIEGAQFFMATIIKGRQSNAHAQAGPATVGGNIFFDFLSHSWYNWTHPYEK